MEHSRALLVEFLRGIITALKANPDGLCENILHTWNIQRRYRSEIQTNGPTDEERSSRSGSRGELYEQPYYRVRH